MFVNAATKRKKKVAGSEWNRKAENRVLWRNLGRPMFSTGLRSAELIERHP